MKFHLTCFQTVTKWAGQDQVFYIGDPYRTFNIILNRLWDDQMAEFYENEKKRITVVR